jgi:hypothetical protein
MLFLLVRALLSPFRERQTSRSIMVGRGLAAAYGAREVAKCPGHGLHAPNEQLFMSRALTTGCRVVAQGHNNSDGSYCTA